MPFLTGLLSSAAAVLVEMLSKLLGYEFFTKIAVIGMNHWAVSKESHNDMAVTEAVAKAWGVDTSDMEKLGDK